MAHLAKHVIIHPDITNNHLEEYIFVREIDDIDIDIDNIYSTYSNRLHIVQFFMQHNHLKKKNNIK